MSQLVLWFWELASVYNLVEQLRLKTWLHRLSKRLNLDIVTCNIQSKYMSVVVSLDDSNYKYNNSVTMYENDLVIL